MQNDVENLIFLKIAFFNSIWNVLRSNLYVSTQKFEIHQQVKLFIVLSYSVMQFYVFGYFTLMDDSNFSKIANIQIILKHIHIIQQIIMCIGIIVFV